MIALKLVFQSLASVAAVASCVGGGCYVMREGNDNNFYLVSAPTATSSTQPSEDLWAPTEGDIAKVNKNKKYTCKTTNSAFEDSGCELYKISKTSGVNSIDLAALKVSKETTTKAMKADLTTLKFFLLKASSSLIGTAKMDGSLTINLLSNSLDSSESSKSYATLTVHAVMKEEKWSGETNLAIAKVTTATTPITEFVDAAETTSVFKCTLQDTAEQKLCSINDLGAFASTALNKISFTSITNIPTKNAFVTALNLTNYYLISWDETTKYPISSLNGKTVVFTESKTNTNTKTTTLTIESGIFGIFNSTTQEAIIIK